MKLISSIKTKRRIAITFVVAFMLSNLLSLFGPNAKAAVTVSAPGAGTCFQHSGTIATGALVTVYSVGTIQISLPNNEINPGPDAAFATTASAAVAQATDTNGDIDDAGDVIGNVFTIVPPTGTNFVIVPGFQNLGLGLANKLAAANATITGAQSQDATTGRNISDLAISVGVVTTGGAGVGRALVALTRDADTTGNGGIETYPRSGTSANTATISITGLGIAIPPSGNGALSGTLVGTFDATPPSGIGASGGVNADATNPVITSAISGISGTFNICTVTSPAGELQAELDADSTTDNYDKSTASANLLALGQIGTSTTVYAFDTTTAVAAIAPEAGTTAGAEVDLEPILVRGKAGTGSSTRDQVFATGDVASDIDTAAEAPSATTLDVTTTFGNSVVAPITFAFSDDNAAATTTLSAVDIIIESSNAATNPTSAGLSTTQSSRTGFLGALRAASLESGNAATNAGFAIGSSWGVASISGGPGTIAVQESTLASATTGTIATFGSREANATEPFNNTFVDLRLFCGASTNPVAGWFAILNSGSITVSTTVATAQGIRNSQAGGQVLVNSQTNFFSQSLTNYAGTNPTPVFVAAGSHSITQGGSNTADNALLYASCSNNVLTIVPIQNGFDATRDVITVTPRFAVTNISSTFASDINIIAQVSGNNLSGTTTLNLAKLVGVPPTGQNSTLASVQGVSVSETSQLGVDCSSGGQSSVVLGSITSGSVATSVAASCTSGAIAPAPPFFTGGANNSVSGNTVIDGSPVVQGEARGILITEATTTGFSELINQVGGGTNGAVFQVSLPTGCDIIDDLDDNNTASSSSSATGALGGNDIARIGAVSTGGITVQTNGTQSLFVNGGAGNSALTVANILAPTSGGTGAVINFKLSAAPGTGTDASVTDSILVRLDAQDIFCPGTVTGAINATVTVKNQVSSPTITANLGTANLGTATKAVSFGFADDVATSTKGEVSTNSMIGATPRLVGGGASISTTLEVKELNARAIPIGGRVSSRNVDPENSLLSSVLTRGQLWIIPSNASAFSTAPAAGDIEFSDNSLVVDGSPTLVTSATINPSAPLGTLLIGVKQNTASGAATPATSTTTIKVKNLQLAAATSSTTNLIASVELFSQDAGVVVNTPGLSSGNNGSTPTVFTPYVQASTKAANQLEAAGVQLGSGNTSNLLITNRLTELETPQINPVAKTITSAKAADTSLITVSSTGITDSTDNVVTVAGAAGAVDGGARVTVATGGTTTYDSVTVVASDDGSFTAKVRGDCTTASSVTVTATGAVSGTSSASVTKTALCQGATESEDTVFADIDTSDDGSTSIDEVLAYVTAQGGLASIVTAGGSTLAGVIKAVKNALGLS